MTLEEIEEFANSLKINDVKYSTTLTDYFGDRTEFSTLGELVSFLIKEYEFWEKGLEQLPRQNSGHLGRIKNETLINIKRFFEGAKQAVSTQQDQNLTSQLQNLYRNQLQSLGSSWIQRNHPAIDKILKLYEIHNYTVVDTFLAILKSPDQNHPIQYPNQMIAFFEYYKFKGYDTDGLFDFAQSTEKTINNIQHELEQSSNQLFETMHSKHEFIDKWHQDQIESFENQQHTQQNTDETRVNNQTNQFNESMSEWQQRVGDLEAEYKENLRFQAPAQYWQHAANTHIFWGLMWGLILLFIVVLGLYELSDFFESWLIGKELKIQLDTIQGAAIFVTFVSVYAFIISVLSKLTLSSVHLYRDAREREQLTHLYLSLSNETNLDSDARNIILQSLFSRADSGLLGKDGGAPVMPIIDMFRKK